LRLENEVGDQQAIESEEHERVDGQQFERPNDDTREADERREQREASVHRLE